MKEADYQGKRVRLIGSQMTGTVVSHTTDGRFIADVKWDNMYGTSKASIWNLELETPDE